MQIRWLKDALSDLESLYLFISENSEQAAQKQLTRIREQVEQLAHFPDLGRAGRSAGTRELVISRTPFIVVYRVRARTLYIVAVLHGARRWPQAFKH